MPTIKYYCEDILSVPFLNFYLEFNYPEHTELDTYVGIYCLHCQEIFNQHKQDVDIMLV